jgi:phosphatidylglycerophosphate synthase
MWVTWANLLTLCRLGLAIPCALAILGGAWPLAAGLFAIAVLTDLLDGPLARRFEQVTPLGGLFDHATDAWFVTIVLAALVCNGPLPWLLPVLVVAAFSQYMLDSRALQGQRLRASWLGRLNGIGYFVIAGAPIMHRLIDTHFPADHLWSDRLWATLAWLLVLSTLVSMINRAQAWYRAK